jgi:serine protease Do
VKADAAYDNKQYDKAKDFYYEAIQILPLESYPTNRIKSINEKLRVDTSSPTANLKELYKKCKPAVFLIYTEKFKSVSQGSGFFITSDGIAVSNYHVYDGGYLTDALIMTEDERTYEVEKVLEKNKDKDYVIFKVKNKNKVSFPILKISSANADIGDNVFAIGNPKGLEKTLSNGIVSGIREDKNAKYIQTTAPITNGSSGGPLFNMKGEVIGITTMGLQDGSIFFALTIKEIPYWRYVR